MEAQEVKQQLDHKDIAMEIATRLDESRRVVVHQIRGILGRLGLEKTQQFVDEALKIYEAGGMPVSNGNRTRSVGGIFFYLVRRSEFRERPPKPEPKAKLPPFKWSARLDIVPKLVDQAGESKIVKITLTGRPGRIVQKGKVVLTAMQSPSTPSLPEELPPVPDDTTTFIVYIARRQWLEVADTMKDPQAELIVQGYPVLDQRLKTVAVFAQSVTARLPVPARPMG